MNSELYKRYYTAIHYLENLNNMAGSYQKTNLTAHPHPEMYLERMQDFLDLIGNPEKDFKYIHITGTAGKGSVSSMIHATLTTQGKNSGLFTSPFVTSTIEKIQVGKKYIDPLVFSDIVETLKPHIDSAVLFGRHGLPSYFEIMFAIALIYFKREQCEYVVLEVGLGGRYDATNIIKQPLITTITNIGLDHTQILGSTTKMIAQDKAGIIKKNSHFMTTESDPALLAIFKKECSEVGARYQPLNVNGLDFMERNCLLAGMICFHLSVIKNANDISLPEIMPARFELVENKPLVIIDGAHNPSKIAATVLNLNKLSYRKLSAVIAISADKDWKTILEQLLPLISSLYVTRFSNVNRGCVNPKELLTFARKHLPRSRQLHLLMDPLQAFNTAKKSLSKNDALLVTGSFYLAGEIRGLYCSEERILKMRRSRLMPSQTAPTPQ